MMLDYGHDSYYSRLHLGLRPWLKSWPGLESYCANTTASSTIGVASHHPWCWSTPNSYHSISSLRTNCLEDQSSNSQIIEIDKSFNRPFSIAIPPCSPSSHHHLALESHRSLPWLHDPSFEGILTIRHWTMSNVVPCMATMHVGQRRWTEFIYNSPCRTHLHPMVVIFYTQI